MSTKFANPVGYLALKKVFAGLVGVRNRNRDYFSLKLIDNGDQTRTTFFL